MPEEIKQNKLQPRVKIIGPLSPGGLEIALQTWITWLFDSEHWNGGPKMQILADAGGLVAWGFWHETVGVLVFDAGGNLLREESIGGLELPTKGLKLVT